MIIFQFKKKENYVTFLSVLIRKIYLYIERNDGIRYTLVACVWCLNLLW